MWALISAVILGGVIILLPDNLDPREQAAVIIVVVSITLLFLDLLGYLPWR